MLEVNIAFPAGASLARMERLVEKCYAAKGLRMTLKGTLAQYPGCVYWHFKQ